MSVESTIWSRQTTGATCIDGMDTDNRPSMQECLQTIQRLEAAAKETEAAAKEIIQRELDLTQQLCEARAHVIKKEQEVCDLQTQLAQELSEKGGVLRELMTRDEQIRYLQKSNAGSKASASKTRASSARLLNVSKQRSLPKTASQSCRELNAGSSNFANAVWLKPEPTLHATVSPNACSPPKQEMLVSPEVAIRGSWKPNQQATRSTAHRIAATAPSSPLPRPRDFPALANNSARVSPNAMANQNQVMQKLQVRWAVRRTM